jgi:dienelactone hydrolase
LKSVGASADSSKTGGGPDETPSSEKNTMNDRITIEGHDGTFAAYIARPNTLPAPAVVVLQELFGVNADIRKHCDELAEQGYLAVTPDLYWRQEPGVDLNVTSQADWITAFASIRLMTEMWA